MALKLKMKKLDEDPIQHQETKPKADIERFYPSPSAGLTKAQVVQRMQQRLNNGEQGMKTKTEKQIIFENVVTFFNIVTFILAILLALVQSYRDLTFIFLVLWNALIGSFQGIRSKRTIDKLSLISSPKAELVRDGQINKVPVSEIVLDDIMLLKSGNQICSDCVVSRGEVEVNESLITGESDPISKRQGDHLLSGSFIISGSCSAQVEHVGAENYASKITDGAKYVKKRTSQIRNSIDALIKIIGFGIIPVGVILFIKQYFLLESGIKNSVSKTAAALSGMIPEGLVLLTSVVFAISVIKLAKHKTLVQDLYCAETLARVDTLCLDKTGTITEGTMQVDEIIPLNGFSEADVGAALAAMVQNLDDQNPTSIAVKTYIEEASGDWLVDDAGEIVPFSSTRKWSGAYFPGSGCFVMGAGEFILGSRFTEIKEKTEYYSAQGQRVLLVASSPMPFGANHSLPSDIGCMGLVIISDKIRREAPRTLRYFADQGVDIKIISGDNAVTVANIAKKAGLSAADNYVDAGTLETDADIAYAIEHYSVFGRVTPQQKLGFVKALKQNGHTVAMTGDGVNDVLALKEADCSIAMASGSDAARTVSSLVLLDSNFASMPKIVEEGRQAINNLQRSAALFLSKTTNSTLIGIIFIFLSYTYPFQNIQLTLISALTIGAPAFLLALEPNRDRIKGSFLSNVMRIALPAGVTMALSTVLLCAMGHVTGITNEQLSTLAVISTTFVGFLLLFQVCSPFNALRTTLFFTMIAVFIIAILFFRDLFYLVDFTLPMILLLIFSFLFSTAIMVTLVHLVNSVLVRFPKTSKKRKAYEAALKKQKRKHVGETNLQ